MSKDYLKRLDGISRFEDYTIMPAFNQAQYKLILQGLLLIDPTDLDSEYQEILKYLIKIIRKNLNE